MEALELTLPVGVVARGALDQEMTPRLSVGIPVYNQASTIATTIDSLLEQIRSPFEIVVSENHSTDGTDRILKRYGDRIRVISPPTHLGMAENWNFVVGRLRGDWFALLSGDDVALPNYVETLMRGITRDPQAVLVRTAWQHIDEAGNRGERKYLLSVGKKVTPPNTLYESLTRPKSSFAAFAVLRTAWESVGGFPEYLKHAVDWGLWIRLASEGNFIYEPTITSLYRVHYRPQLSRSREIAMIHDFAMIYRVTIPEVLPRIPLINMKRVARGRRSVLQHALNNASSLPDEEKVKAVSWLKELAESRRERRLIIRFIRGERVRRVSVDTAVRGWARAIVMRLKDFQLG